MHVSTREYDRFGPWIAEVTEPADVPALYRNYDIDFDAVRLVLKVPRNITRREARPDMDLYDHLMVLDAETLTVLSRNLGPRAADEVRSAGYSVARLQLPNLAAVFDSIELLDGALALMASNGSQLSITYNGAGRPQVAMLLNALREAGASEPSAGTPGAALAMAARSLLPMAPPMNPRGRDRFLITDIKELQEARPDTVVWAVHDAMPLAGGSGGALLAGGSGGAFLTGCALVSDGRTLEVLSRREAVRSLGTPDHSHSRTVVQLSAITGLEDMLYHGAPGVRQLRLHVGAAVVGLLVPEGSHAHRIVATARGYR